MSIPHLLMLGLIDGAGIGLVVDPPETVGELADYGIQHFYAVEGKSRRRMTAKEYQRMRKTIAIYKATRLKAVKDYRYYAMIVAEATKQLNPVARKAA